MSIQSRLKALGSAYGKAAAHVPQKFENLPKGNYSCEIQEVKLITESTAPFAEGELEVQIKTKVIVGESKNRIATLKFFLEQPEKELDDGKKIPSGLATFKGFIQDVGVEDFDMSKNNAFDGLSSALKGTQVNLYTSGKGSFIYSGLLDNDDLSMEDDEDEEVEEDEEVDEDDIEGDDIEDESEDEDEDEEIVEEVVEKPAKKPGRKK